MSEEMAGARAGDTPMVRRRFLTPKVSVGQLATGDELLAYVEKVNVWAQLFMGVCAAVVAGFVGGRASVFGVLCGVVVVLLLSLISVFASRYQSLSRFEGAFVQGGVYLVKFLVIIGAFLLVKYFLGGVINIKVAAVVVLCGIILRLALSAFLVLRTPVALDVCR